MSMTPPHSTVTTDMLHAYVDGQLSADDQALVETHLADNPEIAADVAEWQMQNQQLLQLYADPVVKPRALTANNSNRRSSGLSGWRMAAAITLFVAGAASGFIARPAVAPDDPILELTLNDAFAAHVVYVADPHRPVEVRANEEELLVNWLSRRIGAQLAAPDLSDQGFDLIGGRLVPGETNPAALFMYEDVSGKRVTVFVTTESVPHFASFRFEDRDGLSAAHWTEDNLQFAVVGELDRDAIRTMAVEVYRQII
jgi:anti-sigma factor RsiW